MFYYLLLKKDAIAIARMEEEPDAAARKLTATAFDRGSADNITCIVVKLHDKLAVDSADRAVSSEPWIDRYFCSIQAYLNLFN